MGQLVIILLIALVIFGPRNLPKLGAMLGAVVRRYRTPKEPPPKERSERSGPEDTGTGN